MDAPEQSPAPPRKAPTLIELWAHPMGRLAVLGVALLTLFAGTRCSTDPLDPSSGVSATLATEPIRTRAPAPSPEMGGQPLASPVVRLHQSLSAYDAILRDLEIAEVLARNALQRAPPGSDAEHALNESVRSLAERTHRVRELRAAEIAQALPLDSLLSSTAAGSAVDSDR